MEHKHRETKDVPWRVVTAYTIIIIMAYIYIHYIVDMYGDFIGDHPTFDVLGDYKCTVEFDGCEDQVFDGWAMSRILAFVIVGYANPHAHLNVLIVAVLIQAYAYSHKKPGRYIFNPALTMIGYSIGSALCSGECCPEKGSLE